jgi:type III secretory pathway component EscU
MAKKWPKEVFAGCLELLSESETLFIYLVLPLLCVAIVGVIGVVVYQVFCDPWAASSASTPDYLSINPERWFPHS